jgi:hypothetical protein
MVPDTESELCQLKVTALAPEGDEPNPVPIVVHAALALTSAATAILK